MSADPEVLPKSDFRQGRRVARNVYHGDEPLFMAATDELAAELVLILNTGAAALRAPQNDGAAAMRERAANLVEATQELTSLKTGRRTISERDFGNLIGLAYAEAIRALPLAQPDPRQEPGTGGEE